MALALYAPPSDIQVPDLVPFIQSGDADWHTKYQAAEAEYIEQIKAWAKRTAGSSDIAGEVISLPYADGSAYYVVAKVSGRHALVSLPLGDAWRDPNFEAYATVASVRDMIQRQRAFSRIWEKHSKKKVNA